MKVLTMSPPAPGRGGAGHVTLPGLDRTRWRLLPCHSVEAWDQPLVGLALSERNRELLPQLPPEATLELELHCRIALACPGLESLRIQYRQVSVLVTDQPRLAQHRG